MADSKPPSNIKPPSWPHNDWIGPVDKRSNLRKIHFAEPLEETEREAAYRKMRQETYEWNHQFWARQNQNFIQVKEEFVEDTFAKKGMNATDNEGAKQNLSTEEMAEFYRNFLHDNRQILKEYNREWYRRNFGLLWPALRVTIDKVLRKLIR
ncbi:cytochrome c oxidase assembly factor 8-like [Amphiura filiformis]|uniref:cytochrome c oxidase assembly factor 8-like n=1 Tax=Amphiura filiformis TaxID=82378 RepID=UPI003B20F869